MTLYAVELVNELTGERLTLMVDCPSSDDAQMEAIRHAWRELDWQKVYAFSARKVDPSDEEMSENEMIAEGEALSNGQEDRISTRTLRRFVASVESFDDFTLRSGLSIPTEGAVTRARAELKRRGVPIVEDAHGGTV